MEAWFRSGDPLRETVRPWFQALRDCGPDVSELIHDGHPTACVGDAAFAYVDAFSAHASVGFFQGVPWPIRPVSCGVRAGACATSGWAGAKPSTTPRSTG